MAERRGQSHQEKTRGDAVNRGGRSDGGFKGGLKSKRRQELKPDGTVVVEHEEYYPNGESATTMDGKVSKSTETHEPTTEASQSVPAKGPDKKLEETKVNTTAQPAEVPVKLVDANGVEVGDIKRADVGRTAVEAAKPQLTPEHQQLLKGHEEEVAEKVNETKSIWKKGKALGPALGGFIAGAGVKAFAGWLVRSGVKRAADFGTVGAGAVAGGLVGGGWEFYSSYRSESKRLKNLETYKAALAGWQNLSDLEKVQKYLAVKEALAKNKMEPEANADKDLQADFQALSVFVKAGEWKKQDGAERLEALLKIIQSSSTEAKTISAGAEKEVKDLLKKYRLSRDKKKIALATFRGAAVGAAGGALGGWLFGKLSDSLGWGHHVYADGSDAGHVAETARQVSAEALVEAKRNFLSSHDVLPVKGSVWATVQDYFHSRGIANPSNKLINEGMIRISGINGVEITGHHPGAVGGTFYEGFQHAHFEGAGTVEDIKMSGKEMLKGFASLDDLVREGGGKTLEAQAEEAARAVAAAAGKAPGRAAEEAAKKAVEKNGSHIGWLIGFGAVGAVGVTATALYRSKKMVERMEGKKKETAAGGGAATSRAGGGGGGGGGIIQAETSGAQRVAIPESGNWKKDFAFADEQVGEVLNGVNEIFGKKLEDLTDEDFINCRQDLRYLLEVLKKVENVPPQFVEDKKTVEDWKIQILTADQYVATLRRRKANLGKAPVHTFGQMEDAERDRVFRETLGKVRADLDGIEGDILNNVPDSFEKIFIMRDRVYTAQHPLDGIYYGYENHPLFPQVLAQYNRAERLLDQLKITERVWQIKGYTGLTSDSTNLDSIELLEAVRAKGVKEIGYLALEAAGIGRLSVNDGENLSTIRRFAERMKYMREVIGFSDYDRTRLPQEVVVEYDITWELEQRINEYLNQQESGGGDTAGSPEARKNKLEANVRSFTQAITDYCSIYPREVNNAVKEDGILYLAFTHFSYSNREFTVLAGLESLKTFSRDLNERGREAGEFDGMPEDLRADYKAALELKRGLDAFFQELPEWKWPLWDTAVRIGIASEKDCPEPQGDVKRKMDAYFLVMQEQGGYLNALAGNTDVAKAWRGQIEQALLAKNSEERQEGFRNLFVMILDRPFSGNTSQREVQSSRVYDLRHQLGEIVGEQEIVAAFTDVYKAVEDKWMKKFRAGFEEVNKITADLGILILRGELKPEEAGGRFDALWQEYLQQQEPPLSAWPAGMGTIDRTYFDLQESAQRSKLLFTKQKP